MRSPPGAAVPEAAPAGGDGHAQALAPVWSALVAEATQRAAELRAAASADGEAVLAAAARQADEILSQARARGEADGRAAAAARRVAWRRAARAVVLAAQRDVYDELTSRVHAGVAALRHDPVYPRLLARLGELARAAAGPSAVVTPVPAGGQVAEGPGTFADCSLACLADRAVEALGAEVTALWSE